MATTTERHLNQTGLDRSWLREKAYIDAGDYSLSQRLLVIEQYFLSDQDGAINKWNEIVAFLAGIDASTLSSIVSDLETQIAAKADAATINDTLDDILTQLNDTVSTDAVGAAGGVASLDNSGKVPTSQLPLGNGLATSSGTIVPDIASNSDIVIDGNGQLDTMGKTTKFGVCTTAANTATKDVVLNVAGGDTFSLQVGTRIAVVFSNTNTADTPELRVGVQGNMTTKTPIYYKGSQITTNSMQKGLLTGTVEFIYHNGRWNLLATASEVPLAKQEVNETLVNGSGLVYAPDTTVTLQDESTMVVPGGLKVDAGDGLEIGTNGKVKAKLTTGTSLQFNGGGLDINVGTGLQQSESHLEVKKGAGIKADSNGVAIDMLSTTADTTWMPDNPDKPNGATVNPKFYPVQMDAGGKVGVKVPWENTATQSQHYTPSGGEPMTNQDGNTGTYAKDTMYTVLTGVEATVDGKGHITDLTYTAQQIKDTNTEYSAGDGLRLQGTEFRVYAGTGIEIENYQGSQKRVAIKEAGTTERGAMKVQEVMGANNPIDYLISVGKNYPVKMSSDGVGFVAVPWTDTNTEYTPMTKAEATAGTDLTGRVVSAAVLDHAIGERIPEAMTNEEIDEIFARNYKPSEDFPIYADPTTLNQIAFYIDVNKPSADGALRVDKGGSESMRAALEESVIPALVDASGNYVLLDRNDARYMEDGTPVIDLTTGEMLPAYAHLDFLNIIPQHYGFVQTVTEGATTFVRVWYSPVPIPGGFIIPQMAVGRFKASVVDGKLRSLPGKVPAAEMTINAFWNAAQARSTDHGLSNANFRSYLLMHMMAKYGWRDSQLCQSGDGTVVWGCGLDGTESDPSNYPSTGFDRQKNIKTGHTLGLGMEDGKAEVADANNTTVHGVSVAGFENAYGQYWEFCQGLASVGATVYKWDTNFMPSAAPTAATFDGVEHETFSPRPTQNTQNNDNSAATNTYNVATLFVGESGLTPIPSATVRRSVTPTVSTGDGYWYNASGQLWLFCGASGYGARVGLAAARSNAAWSASAPSLSARLAYYGRVAEVTKEEILNN